MSSNGLQKVQSKFSFEKTAEKIETGLRDKGFTLFMKIDHAKNATRHGRELSPTLLFIFGNPKTGGTGLMQENPEIAIDLPSKILVFEDKQGDVYLLYNDMEWLAQRHGLSSRNREVVLRLKKGISNVVESVS